MESFNLGVVLLRRLLNGNGSFFISGGTWTLELGFKLRVVASSSQSPMRSSFSNSVMGGVMASRREAAEVNSSMALGVVRKMPVGLSSAKDLAVYRSSSRSLMASMESSEDGGPSSVSTSDGASTSVERRVVKVLVWGTNALGVNAKLELAVRSESTSASCCFMVIGLRLLNA